MMTPAEEMRVAAKALRDEAAWPGEDLPLAVAGLLEEIARQYDAPPCDSPGGVCNGCERREDFNDALRVARTVLGAVPELAAERTREERARTAESLRERGER